MLEALCTVYPTLNFALMDSDCVPTTLFEIAELVNLMTDQTSRAEALQSYTMASARDCPPAVLLMTESKAELNAGLVVVTGHMPAPTTDVDMAHGSDTPSQAAPSGLSSEQADQGTTADECDPRAPKSRRIATPADRKSPAEWMAKLCASRTDFLSTSAVPVDPSDALLLLGGLLLTPLLGCTARTPLDWTHAWAMLGEWAGKVSFPVPAPGVAWPRHGRGRYLRPDFIQRTPPFLSCARPIFEQGALPPMSVFPANFPILCLPGDKLFQSKDVDDNYCLPPIVHSFLGNKVRMGRKLQALRQRGLAPLSTALLGVDQLPPLLTHPTGCDFVRGARLTVRPHVAAVRTLTPTQVLLLQSLWTPAELPHQHNSQMPWATNCEAVPVFCGQHASLKLSPQEVQPLYGSLCRRLQIPTSNPELTINEILASHTDPKYKDWQTVMIESTAWQINPTDTGDLVAQCTGLGGSELDEEWDVLLACKKDAHVYGPSLSKQDDWDAKRGTIAGTAQTQEYLMLHLALFPVGLHVWSEVHGVQQQHQVQAQIIHRAQRLLKFGPVTPAHRKPPWAGYKQSLRLFTKLLATHPLAGICRPPNLSNAEIIRHAEQIGVTLSIRGHSAGSYAGIVWEEILSEFPNIEGTTVLTAVAFPPTFLSRDTHTQTNGNCILSTMLTIVCVSGPHPEMT